MREIDPEASSNAPRYKRIADGLFIEFDLGVLAADRDADGLTDIVERRLGLKLDDPDTDEDSLADGTDPLPLTPFDPNAPEPVTAAASAILLYAIMYDAGVVMNDRPVPETDDHACERDSAFGSEDRGFVQPRRAAGQLLDMMGPNLSGNALAYCVMSPAPRHTTRSPGCAAARTKSARLSRLSSFCAQRCPCRERLSTR